MRLAPLVAVALLVAGCTGRPVLANPPVVPPEPASPAPSRTAPPDPQPIVFPRDDAAHDRLTEWWYVTGHLTTADGRRFGFEDVVFRAERGNLPVSWASHLALTDERGGRFLYAQRSEIGGDVDRAGATGRELDLEVDGQADASGPDASGPGVAGTSGWSMRRTDDELRLAASAAASEVSVGGVPGTGTGPAFGLDLRVADSPPVLHGASGWVDFGPAGGSYYYSRTRQRASGTLTLDGVPERVTGTAWFDHQWGDFISVGGGGWDWFAVNLGDGTDVTLSLVRSADRTYPLVYGTLVRRDGSVVHLEAPDFAVTASGAWTSPATRTRYPAGWRIELPAERLSIDLRPTVAAQELDTRATTGVTYWEGSQVVTAVRGGRPIGGEGYVELTGYAPGG